MLDSENIVREKKGDLLMRTGFWVLGSSSHELLIYTEQLVLIGVNSKNYVEHD